MVKEALRKPTTTARAVEGRRYAVAASVCAATEDADSAQAYDKKIAECLFKTILVVLNSVFFVCLKNSMMKSTKSGILEVSRCS